ncbi:uncharacterized protein LOC129614040 [Condylostylus longicornis]|uniref:uncharacterized protein LOC129614040 n=1 Tax=Condylostylus longicornis TaxID=2530218 RepID=UPI00244DE391|nr:uncharacterized protein LOC129614040 [Condylostylus longicornis]
MSLTLPFALNLSAVGLVDGMSQIRHPCPTIGRLGSASGCAGKAGKAGEVGLPGSDRGKADGSYRCVGGDDWVTTTAPPYIEGSSATGNHLINVFPSKSPSNKSKKLAVATWNVRSLAMPGKLENLEKEKKRLNLDIIGISETHMIGNDERETEENYLFYSGPDANHPKRNGVGFLISKHLKNHVNCIIPKSDRSTERSGVGATAEKDDEEVEKFYEEIKVLLKNASKEDCLVVLGDFNAKVGNEEVNNVAGKYGLGQRNMRGSKLIDFCIENNLVVANTWFQQPKRRLYTWTAPGSTNSRIIQNSENKNRIASKINDELESMEETIDGENDCNKAWIHFKTPLNQAVKDLQNVEQRHARTKWMTQEILIMMEERRRWKQIDHAKYKEINKTIKRKIRDAKTHYWENECKEIENLDRIGNSAQLHKKIKSITNSDKKKTPKEY